jgi:MFS family permease
LTKRVRFFAAVAPPAVLLDANFRIYALGNLISYIGTWAQRVAIGWLSWELTHQTVWVGLISLAQILPLVAFGPVSGALLDRHNHRYFAMTVNSAMAALAWLLYALTAAHLMHIVALLVIALLLGVANSGYQAARLTMIHEVVAPALLTQAIAANSVIFNLSRAVGPAIGGIVIAHYGLAAAFAVNAISFLGILAALAAVQLRSREVNKPTQGLFAESREGWRYVIGHAGIRQMMLLSAVTAILARGVIELLPVFADTVFHRGSLGLANLTTAVGAGAIVGAMALALAGSTHLLPRVTRLAAIALGPLVILFGLCKDFGFGLSISVVHRVRHRAVQCGSAGAIAVPDPRQLQRPGAGPVDRGQHSRSRHRRRNPGRAGTVGHPAHGHDHGRGALHNPRGGGDRALRSIAGRHSMTESIECVVIGAGVVGLGGGARAGAARPRDLDSGSRVLHRHRDQFAQQRSDPCRHLLSAGIGEGPLLRGGQSASVRVSAKRTASGTGAAASSSSPRMSRRSRRCNPSKAWPGPTESAIFNWLTAGEIPRSSRN